MAEATQVYSIDSSSLIRGWAFQYPPDVFPGVWEKLGALIRAGQLVATEEVLHELSKQDDELLKWSKHQNGLFVNHDEKIQQAVREILKTHPALIRLQNNRSGADPFVIALARVKACAVVTEEGHSRNPDSKPHIPDVCKAYGVRSIRLIDALREQKAIFKQ